MGNRSSVSALLVIWIAVLVATIGVPPAPASPLAWDGLNGLGLAGLTLLLLVCWLAPSTQSGYSVHALRAHIALSIIVVSSVLIHALGIILSNDVAIEYLKWRAPAYMHAGNLGFVLMLVLSALSIKRLRRRLHANFHQFRNTHRFLSVAAIVLAGWHVVGTGFLSAAGHGVSQAWKEGDAQLATLGWRGWLMSCLLVLTTAMWFRAPNRNRELIPHITHDLRLRNSLGRYFALLVVLVLAYTAALQWPSWPLQESTAQAGLTLSNVAREPLYDI